MVDACEKEQTALLKEYVLQRSEELKGFSESEVSAAGPLSISPFVPCAPSRIPYILQAARLGPEDVLYDLGCGDGVVLHQAALRCGCRCVGLDIDAQCLDIAAKRAEELGIAGLCRWGRCDLCALPAGALSDAGDGLERPQPLARAIVEVRATMEGKDEELPLPTAALIFLTAHGLVRVRPWLHGEWCASPTGLRLVTCVESLDTALDYSDPEGVFAEANELRWPVCRSSSRWGVFVVPPHNMALSRWEALPEPPLRLSRCESEATEPLLLPGLLSQEDIALVDGLALAHISAEGSHNGDVDESCISLFELPDEGGFHGAVEDALHSLSQHRVLHLHGIASFAEESCGLPALERRLLAAIKAHDPWGLTRHREVNLRSLEFHAYTEGGSVLDPEHRDDGSLLTLSILLSAPEDFQGGSFITWQSDERVKHQLARGDGILFVSEKRHNVEVVHGRRRALIVEIWDKPRNTRNRWS